MVREPVITFRGGEIAAPYIIQGTKAIFLAALADDAETVIHGVDLLRRRYPTIFESYSALGARIEYEGTSRVALGWSLTPQNRPPVGVAFATSVQ